MFYQQLNGKMRRLCPISVRKSKRKWGYFKSGVPNLGYIYLQGYICLSEEVHLRLAIDEKMCLHIIYFQIFIHTSVIIIFKNHNTLIVKYIFIIYIWKIMIKDFVIRNFRGTSSSVEWWREHAYLLKFWRGVCSSVGLLKGFMVRERLGTPASDQWAVKHYLHRFFYEIFNFG